MNNLIRTKSIPDIVESGSNQYGSYQKFRDGTMTCRGWNYTQGNGTNNGAIKTITLPQSFLDINACSISCIGTGYKQSAVVPSTPTDITGQGNATFYVATMVTANTFSVGHLFYSVGFTSAYFLPFTYTVIGKWSNSYDVAKPTISIGRGIIESASNANGSYIKYEDGTMECWGQISFSATSTTGLQGNAFTFPMPFSTTPSLTGTAVPTVTWSGFSFHTVGHYSNTVGQYQLINNGTAQIFAINWRAIGRWQSATNMVGEYTYGQGIVETGSNTNGSWIKFDNGTMECWWEDSTGRTTATLDSPSYYYVSTITYPASFLSGTFPVISGAPRLLSGQCSCAGYRTATPHLTLDLYSRGNLSTNQLYPGYRAKGRWK